MKPYQIFTSRSFPLKELKQNKKMSNKTQMTLWGGEKEEIKTSIKLENLSYDHDLIHLIISSAIRIKTNGFVKHYIEKKKSVETVSFHEFFHPVSFSAYYYPPEEIIIFQSPKDVCKEVGKFIRDNPSDFENLELIERHVDFGKIGLYVNEFFSTWFRGISTEVRAANLTGTNIQEDPYFQEFLSRGVIKNVVIPLEYENTEHRIMVTEHSAVVLVNDYRNLIPLELALVLEAKRNIVEKLWKPLDE
jgi:hypothetical protein